MKQRPYLLRSESWKMSKASLIAAILSALFFAWIVFHPAHFNPDEDHPAHPDIWNGN